MRILVIGYGNTLRGDDGAGFCLAEHIEAHGWPNVCAIACHQLTPELAIAIAESDRVIFVDAAIPGTLAEVTIRPIQGRDELMDAHHSQPASLLQLAHQLYGHAPEAYQVLIPTYSMAFSETLSQSTQSAFAVALRQIQSLCLAA